MAPGGIASPPDTDLRVMLVDDSPAVRRLVTAVLNAEPRVRVVGVASDGYEALALFPQCQPDVVVLDLEMPGLDGPATFAELEARSAMLPVVVFTGIEPPTEGMLGEAIARGQVTAVTKPTGVANLTDAFSQMRATLVPAIKAGSLDIRFEAAAPRPSDEPTVQPAVPAPIRPRSDGAPRIDAVLIGSSTGGPDALDLFFSTLRAPLPVPTFVVQHISAQFSSDLVRRLAKHVAASVEAVDGTVAQPGLVYLAPGGRHLTLARDQLGRVIMRITDSPPVNSCRPSVDVLFESAADIYGASQLGIILTGMGQDGLAGCRRLADEQATVLAQDEASSVIWGMPGSVVKADLADRVMPVAEMAQLLNRWLLDGGPSGESEPHRSSSD